MRKVAALFFILSIAYTNLYGQGKEAIRLATTNADCIGALEINDTIMGPMIAPKGFGNVLEIKGNDKEDPMWFEQEHNSIWYRFVAPNTTTFTFDVVPNDVADDFDFLLFESTGPNFCKKLRTGQVEPIRTNISRNDAKVDSKTGIAIGEEDLFVAAGPGSAYSKAVKIEKGQEYYLVLDNPNTANRGLTMYFYFGENPNSFAARRRKRPDAPIRKSEIPKKMSINIIDAISGEPMMADIAIEGITTGEVLKKEGATSYVVDVKNYRSYTISCSMPGYMLYSRKTITDGGEEFSVDIKLKKIEKGDKVSLENIKFVGNKAEILPTSEQAIYALENFMKQNPDVKIEIQGHVNGIGKKKKKVKKMKKLSVNRSKAVYNYLLLKGVDKTRMKFKGYGASQMLYPEPITPDQSEANRRVEIQILEK